MVGAKRASQAPGFVLAEEQPGSAEEAFALAGRLVDRAYGRGALEVLGDFVIAPPAGSPTRDFQTLHFDFGLPLEPRVERDAALCTALWVCRDAAAVTASTRLVSLAGLLRQRGWPERGELIARLARYGRTHGAWDQDGYNEGSLARIVEAAAGTAPALPAVRAEPGFLCGMEFDSLRAELDFFDRHELDVEAVATEVPLRPGQLLLFDNLALAHGRRGRRAPGELHQRVFGLKRVSVARQRQLRERLLAAF